MTVDEKTFRQAMSHFASGVTVVTTEEGGRLYGMTVASFASLSLDPPLVLVCVESNVKTHDAIVLAGRFGVNILSSAQTELSNRFASRSDDKFAGVELVPGTLGVPLLKDCLATLECRLEDRLPGGDHSIFIGLVEQAHMAEGDPLLYFRSGYRSIG